MITALIPLIKVIDKSNGKEHIVGLDSHDTLHVSDEGISYYNLQNGCGTGGEEAEYEFVTYCDDDYMSLPTIKFVTIEELLEIYRKETFFTDADVQEYIEAMNAIRENFKKRSEAKKKSGMTVID